MANVSLTPIIGKKKSRSVKKALMYSMAALIGFVVVAVVHFVVTVWRLAKALLADVPFVADWDAATEVKILVLLLLLYVPVLIWLLLRVWYKYTHWQDEVLEERERTNALWDILNGGRDKLLEALRGRVVIDTGQYTNNEGTRYTKNDLRKAANGAATLEELERNA